MRKALTAYMGTFPITAVVLEQKRQFYNRGEKINKDRLKFFFFSISVLIHLSINPKLWSIFFLFYSNQVFGSLYSLFFFTWRHFRVYERETNRVQFIYFRGHNSRLMFHEKQFITQETPCDKPTNNTILSVAIPSMYSSRVLFFFVYDLCAITMGQKLTCVLHGQVNINLNIFRIKTR